ncbi:MAG: methyltransferase domain-containing protein [Candidatus Sabulitectum sp.]|nr:methyltransferase domain-containing protein [Candidatus Sabulitectum sp.]
MDKTVNFNTNLLDWSRLDIPENRSSLSQKELLEKVYSLIPSDMGNVLDVGARDCFIGEIISDVVEFTIAIDLVLSHKKRNVDILPIVGTGCDLPFNEHSFDIVLCLEVLEHIPAQAVPVMASELSRVTGKYVLVGVPFEQDIRLGKTTCAHCNRVNPPWGHRNTFSLEKLRALFPELVTRGFYFSGASKNRTNWLSSALMSFSGNPNGTYNQIEKCIYCNELLLKPTEVSKVKKLCSSFARFLNRVQRPFVSTRPSHIHILFEKID